MKYLYPAIFLAEEKGGYSVSFPDIRGCYTQGETSKEAYNMAEEALSQMLSFMEDKHIHIPEASQIETIKAEENSFITMVNADTNAYRRMLNKKAVRKSISIPEWMDVMVKQKNINLSNFVQQALRAEFGL